jgi:hypothetical protein
MGRFFGNPEKERAMSEKALEWDEEALKKLERVPSFVRGMAKGKIEKAAAAMGAARITAELVDRIRKEEM